MNALALLLPFVCVFAALLRAPIVALPLLPPCALIAAWALGLVDLESASHPLRILVPLASMALAFGVALREQRSERDRYDAQCIDAILSPSDEGEVEFPKGPAFERALACAVLLFASAAVDIIALPLWRIPGTWALVPVQIGVCVLVIGVLLAPERWIRALRLHRV